MRVSILLFAILSHTIGASEPERFLPSAEYSDMDIAEAARLMHTGKGLSAWRVLGDNRPGQNRDGELFFSAQMFSEPQKVGERLCRALRYDYNVFDFPGSTRWDLFDRGNGFTVEVAAILQPGDIESCTQLSLHRYFFMHNANMEDNMLVSFYNSLVKKLKTGKVEGVDPESFIVRGITLLPSYGGGYKYNASIETKGKMIYIPIKIESVEFHLKD